MTPKNGKAAPDRSGAPEDGALHFLPLGGTGEIGMNFYLYGVDGQWLIVDCGIAFGDESTPGIDVILPDPDFVENRTDRIAGLVLTHAHEDHLGAIQYLWPRLGCPVYCTPFTAEFLRLKLREVDFGDRVPIKEVPLGGRIELGPFDVEFVSMTHSIPEPNALAIRTRHGTVVHTGDWKLDPDPLIGGVADVGRLREIGEEGVLALVCDSTNVFEPGVSGSEADVRKALTDVIAAEPNRVAVTCFATNVAADPVDRRGGARQRPSRRAGRAAPLWRIWEAASKTGYLTPPEPFVSEHDAGFLPRDKVVLICTGSQGEPRAALSKLGRGTDHPQIVLEPRRHRDLFVARDPRQREGDRPNPEPAGRDGGQGDHPRAKGACPRLRPPLPGRADRDVPVDAAADRPCRCMASGGIWRSMPRLARQCQVKTTIVPEDGMMIRLAPGAAEIDGHVTAGRLALDGKRLIDLHGDTMRAPPSDDLERARRWRRWSSTGTGS